MLTTPGVLHTDKNGNTRMIDLTTRLLADRIVMCTGEVNDDLAESVVSQLLYLEAEDPDKPITMIVDGPGGSVISGLSIIDTMETISCPINTTIIGEVASMSAVIAVSGQKGERKIMPNAKVMLHTVSSGVQGKVQDMRINMQEADKLNTLLMKRIANCCGKDLKQVEKDCDRDFWLTAEEALKYGCCDKIVKSKKAKANTTKASKSTSKK